MYDGHLRGVVDDGQGLHDVVGVDGLGRVLRGHQQERRLVVLLIDAPRCASCSPPAA
jgi:hypothetical protein